MPITTASIFNRFCEAILLNMTTLFDWLMECFNLSHTVRTLGTSPLYECFWNEWHWIWHNKLFLHILDHYHAANVKKLQRFVRVKNWSDRLCYITLVKGTVVRPQNKLSDGFNGTSHVDELTWSRSLWSLRACGVREDTGGRRYTEGRLFWEMKTRESGGQRSGICWREKK